METAKDEVRRILEALPDDATLEDIQYRIYVRQAIDAGLRDIAEGRTLSHEDAVRLHDAIVEVMNHAVAEVARRDEPIEVKVRDFLKVRMKDQCPRCGAKLRRAGVRGMDAYFCPHCQPATRSALVDWTKTGK